MAPVGSISKSPFFRPSEKPEVTQTPGGTRHRRRKSQAEVEHKSTMLGCSANLINAIVGSGIVGLPFAIQQAGFVAGIGLVILCAILTEKSLRLLVETAKHVHVPSYETLSEAAFGRVGYLFVAINMIINAYGAMLSYLMIVKDSFSMVLRVDPTDQPMRRSILFIISLLIIVPLSSQRDVADLAKTSRMNVTFDFIMVLIVLYCAPIRESWATFDWTKSIVHSETIFVGLGVLSFAFVCQHTAFIIAGSLEKPTKDRWANVTQMALLFACGLALCCGVGGFIGFQDKTQGNILNSLDEDSLPANIARGLLGVTMLFVYPMESFVARHVCVVLFFQGRSAHEGDDTSVLNRRDRRITLTILLYLIAVVPAALFQNVGMVLAASGAVGGSCLAYIGPGAVYLGVHGARFLELSRVFFGRKLMNGGESGDEEMAPLYNSEVSGDLPESADDDSWLVHQLKSALWYLLLMPIWTAIASYGKATLTQHVSELALKSPYPIRIGNVRFASTQVRGGATRVVMLPQKGSSHRLQQLAAPTITMLIQDDSLPNFASTSDGRVLALPPSSSNNRLNAISLPETNAAASITQKNYESINTRIGAMAKRKKQEEELALEDDPQQDLPSKLDFLIAIFFILFGIVAMVAGLVSLYLSHRG